MDLGLLGISKGSGYSWRRRVGVLLDLDIKSVGDDTLGRAERANDDGRVDGL